MPFTRIGSYRASWQHLRFCFVGVILFTCSLSVPCGGYEDIASKGDTSPLSPAITSGKQDPFSAFSELVAHDNGLSDDEKARWISLTEKTFHERVFSFDWSLLVYGILSQARFEDVSFDHALLIAVRSAVAVENGAPEESVSDLSSFAFAENLSEGDIELYATYLHRAARDNVPLHVAQEMVHNYRDGGWDLSAFTILMEGIFKAAREGLDCEKVALFMIISMAQRLGTPETIVNDAMNEPQRQPSESLQDEQTETEHEQSTFSVDGPRRNMALNYSRFKFSVESFLGTPYVWGGTSRAGVDCSGFTRLVLWESGYLLPRVSRNQARVGFHVYPQQLRLGDLVFFDTKGRGFITHVGLYLGGNLVAHASSTKGVTLVLLTDPYFRSRYVTARRIIRDFYR